MLSGMLVGSLRVGAVLLTAGGMSAGVYFLVQAGDAENASQVQGQATATAEAGQLSPPQDVLIPPVPTPTFPPAPTPPAIDTSDWLTYESPLGFTIKYPPGWLPENTDIEGLVQGRAKIFNEKAQEGRAQRLAVGELSGGGSGEAWIEIVPLTYPPRFDLNELFQICRPDNPLVPEPEPANRRDQVTFAGRPAVRCTGEGTTASGQLRINVDVFWVDLPSGSVGHIAVYAIHGADETFELLQAMLASVTFGGSQ